MPQRTLLIIPAFNEEGAIGGVIREVRELYPDLPILVVDDCSRDATVDLARQAGAQVMSLPCHLGLGGCVQAGYKLAFELGYGVVIRIDGDGQHDPRDIARLLETLERSGCEMVIGVRAKEAGGLQTHFVRKIGIQFFRLLLRPILGRTVTDPTSGFVAVNRRALEVFSRSFPLEYPEIEALVVLQRRRFRFEEVPCRMRQRMAGRSSITALKSVYYVIHVLLGVFINILRFDGRPRSGAKTGAPAGR
jgi:glycosyltransferase involved in cell wall biosynthesis